ncbi:hypothetical protein ROJ8625_03619 [Roseivivax jejudonensis]|uniref:Recombinase n=1 Tax=Roseivivax jejudonensis TaxID=1529041 RepID=A0A1X7A5W4_9RHOB|nr:recombinase family protein [Roseivivax jejudonensis]SLN69533.1 hypothetical protein ROJ8625_03619 [Roseivivax jejudonensis]
MTRRAAIYTRYSSARQDVTSTTDQVAMCQEYCDKQGYTVVHVFSDQEKTGKNTRRPGFQRLKAAAEAGEIDVVVIEAVDRLTRRLADALTTFDLFRFRGASLESVKEGPQDFLRVLMLGMGAQFYADNVGAHTLRARRGGISRGRIGTTAYGYRSLEIETGLNREIDPDQAAVVHRIFNEFASGRSPHAIADGLNADGIRAPRGGTWNSSTIRGNADRQEGLLRNRLYTGRAAICRTRTSHHPETGTKKVELTPEEMVEAEFPSLRIVSEELWDAVQAELARRHEQYGQKGNAVGARRTRYLLSDLLKCACCGANYIIYNRTSYRCAESRKNACNNTVGISRRRIEARVFGKLRDVMMSEDLIERFQATLKAERKALANVDLDDEHRRLAAALRDAERGRDNMLAAIEQGAPYETFAARAGKLEAEITWLTAKIDETSSRKQARNAPLPDARAIYGEAVARMEALLSDPTLVEEAHGYIAALVPRIELMPDPEAQHGIAVRMHTRFALLIGEAADGAKVGETTVIDC